MYLHVLVEPSSSLQLVAEWRFLAIAQSLGDI